MSARGKAMRILAVVVVMATVPLLVLSHMRKARTHHGLWTIFLIPKLPDPDEGVLYYSSKSISSGGLNATMYKNPRVDEIIDNLVGRILARLGVENQLFQEWHAGPNKEADDIP